MQIRTILLFLLLSSVSPTLGDEPDPRSQLVRRIRETIEELQAIRQDQRRQEVGHQKQLESVERRIADLREQVAELDAAVAQERQQLKQLQSETKADKQAISESQAAIGRVSVAALGVAHRAQQRIERAAGKQQAAAMTDAAQKLRPENGASRQLEGLRELSTALGEDWVAARTVTLANEAVLLEGGARREHAWVVGFGLATKAFVSESGQIVGLWSGDAGSPWKLDLPEQTQDEIRRLMSVVRETSPPAVTPLPVLIPAAE